MSGTNNYIKSFPRYVVTRHALNSTEILLNNHLS